MKKRYIILLLVLGGAFLITFAVLMLSGPHMIEQPSVHAFEAEMPLPPEDAIPFDHDAFDPSAMELPESTQANLEKGRVYYGYYCVFCHGEKGDGNGPVGQSYTPKPADLRALGSKNYSKEALYRAAFTGTGHTPVLERVVPQDQRKFILAYIKNGLR